MDTLLGPLLDNLRGCVCGALSSTLGGEVCACLLVSGQEATADWCACGRRDSCGMAWVRLADMFPAGEGFPNPDRTSRRASGALVLAAVLEVGVYRCLPTVDSQGRPPSVVAQTQAALVAADDAQALARGIFCCQPLTRRPHLLGRYVPRAAGDCGGGTWTVTVLLSR